MFAVGKMRVLKRDGSYEPVSLDKVQTRIQKLSEGLSTIDPISIALKVCSQIYDGVATTELDELAASLCTSMMTENPEYGVLGSRIIVSNNHKNTSPSFSETISVLYANTDVHGKNVPLVSEAVYKITMKNKGKLNKAIDYNRDFTYDYFGFKTLEKGYLLKIKGKPVERIQHMLMRISLGLHSTDLKAALKSYEYMSLKYFTHATPTMYHSGTPLPQLLSCFLLSMEDSIHGIYKTIGDCAQISKWAGGIGLHIHDIRSQGAGIRGTNGNSDGIIPMLRVLNATARYVNQSGKRKGSFAIYLEPWHADIMEFLDIRKNHGDEEKRCRDLFTAMWISDLFMERVFAEGDWTLFDPDECPGLSDVYGQEFRELYTRYEREGKAKQTVKAQEIWRKIIDSQIETGTPYMLYKDAVNLKSNQANVGTIKSSNLCAEIVEYSDEKEYACCTLASLSLPHFVDLSTTPPAFDFRKLIEVLEVVVGNLNQVIDLNYYPVEETRRSNLRHRPLGIGVQGLADVFIMMGLPFESEAAAQLNRDIFEAIHYGSLKASADLAVKYGPYESFAGSPISQGKFQFDLWNEYQRAKNKPEFERSKNPVFTGLIDWEALRAQIMSTGVRNSLLNSVQPTATTSQILGNNESIEPFTSNLYIRRTLAGEFICVNRHLVKMLWECGKWTPALKDMIIKNRGSVQAISGLSPEIKELFKTAWEIKQKAVIDQSIQRGPFVCQTQSLNLFLEDVTFKKLSSAHFYGYEGGLKTGSYYIRTRAKVMPQQFTIEPVTTPVVAAVTGNTSAAGSSGSSGTTTQLTPEEEARLVCSLTNREACEMCSS